MGHPVVAVTAYGEPARWGLWDTDAVLLPRTYVDALVAAGAVPLLVPPVATVDGGLLDRVDALVVAGGPDVDPARYGARPHATTASPRVQRDDAETALLAAALGRGLPVLGICRGMQVLNVVRGGTLHQHLPERVGHDDHAPAPGTYGRHPVRVAAGSLLARSLGSGAEPYDVPTYHHQAVDLLGEGLVAAAWAADGTVEAVEDPVHPFALGVQWHPEVGDDPALFAALVGAARSTAG